MSAMDQASQKASRPGLLRTAAIVFAKELLDALRDRRTLAVVFVSSVLTGPLVLVALSAFIATFETRAERREIVVFGGEYAPTLMNFVARQTYTVKPAPPDFEAQLRTASLGDPVLVVGKDFEAELAHGEWPKLVVVSDSANKQAESGTGRLHGLLSAFARERSALGLATLGVGAAVLQPIDVQERDLASTQTRAAQFTAMLPFFVMMAVLYGALNAALDTTAGERERGSLEPLLTNPGAPLAFVIGHWAAVAVLGVMVAVVSCLSFLPAQWLLRSDTLQAMFQFGWHEVLVFLVVLLPFAAAISAVLMAIAIRCKTHKEAQANATVVVFAVSLLPLVTVLNPGGEAWWHVWVPALAQNTLMTRVLKGEALGVEQIIVPVIVCSVLALLALGFVARRLRSVASA